MKKFVAGLSVVASFAVVLPIIGNANPVCRNGLLETGRGTGAIFGRNLNNVPRGYFQIGYESEFLFEEAGPILRDYGPAENEVTAASWRRMTDAEHITWLRNKFANKPEFAVETGLRALVPIQHPPEQVVIDSTGNLELVYRPFDSYREWETVVNDVTQKYGFGSQQAMVSKPRPERMMHGTPEQRVAEVETQLGWFNYTSLKDMFDKMANAYERFQRTPDRLTLQFFDHPFLGPMTRIKRNELERYMRENAQGNLFDQASNQFVRKSDASFKYTGGPSYRPDIGGPQRLAWEIRNAHKNLDDLKAKVQRDLYASLGDQQEFRGFHNVESFDSIQTFADLPAPVQAALRELFPSKANPAFQYTENELRSLETYRNFALPLMNFSSHARQLTRDATSYATLTQNITRAQLAYRTSLLQIAQQLSEHRITPNLARAQVMGHAAKFAHDSGLAAAFEQYGRRIDFSPAAPVARAR